MFPMTFNLNIMYRLFLILTFLLPTFVFAQKTTDEPSLTLEVSTDTILLGNYLEIKYTAVNVDGKIEPPTFENFDVVGGPTYSTSMSIINGVTTKRSSYSYFIQPKNVGLLHLEPAYLHTEEIELETSPHDIVCLPNPEGIIGESRISEDNQAPRFDRFPLQREVPKKKLKVTKI